MLYNILEGMAAQEQHCSECGRDPCECYSQQDEDIDNAKHYEQEEPNTLKRSAAFLGQPRDPEYVEEISNSPVEDEEVLEHNARYQKRFKQALLCSESYSQEPDLDVYFDDFHLSAQQRIAICRTYANYLTQKLRASGKMAAARVHSKTNKQ